MTPEAGRARAKQHFAKLLDRVAHRPLNYFADKYGLSYGATLDLIQGRVLPSRAMVVLLHAIEAEPEWMQDVVKHARSDLALLDKVRGKADGPQ